MLPYFKFCPSRPKNFLTTLITPTCFQRCQNIVVRLKDFIWVFSFCILKEMQLRAARLDRLTEESVVKCFRDDTIE